VIGFSLACVGVYFPRELRPISIGALQPWDQALETFLSTIA